MQTADNHILKLADLKVVTKLQPTLEQLPKALKPVHKNHTFRAH